ncbi:MAG TPA: undecaprenyldiphospho-muramoylpentapeptide beta-N-acetylglucosaminyltransferase [Verrucomicrobiae bacterium]
MNSSTQKPLVAIACGGTGGHLFPGLAVAGELQRRGCAVALLISPKDVDQQAVKTATGVEIFTLPAVGLQDRNYFSFAVSFWSSFRAAQKIFRQRPPAAVLAMGGFTSAPPVLAARKFQAKTFLHESNTIPGKANRFLARFVAAAFVGFPEAAARLKTKKTSVTGTPVRPQFSPASSIQHPASSCRKALGLNPELPTVLVVGGSQGARGLNDLVLSALPLLAEKNWQWLHLTGANDFEKVQSAYAKLGLKAVVKPFLAEMDLALGAATACVSRAGASSLAEIAAMRLPSALVPLPTAADNHQYFNAVAFEKTGAARLLEQKNSPPEKVAAAISELVESEATRSQIQSALAQWHAPNAAAQIAENILAACWSSSFSLPAQNRLKPELQQSGGKNCSHSA